MKPWRAVVAILAALVWLLSAPLAMASNHCLAMGAMCEGPCGASSCVVSAPTSNAVSDAATPAYGPVCAHLPDPPAVVLELPPK